MKWGRCPKGYKFIVRGVKISSSGDYDKVVADKVLIPDYENLYRYRAMMAWLRRFKNYARVAYEANWATIPIPKSAKKGRPKARWTGRLVWRLEWQMLRIQQAGGAAKLLGMGRAYGRAPDGTLKTFWNQDFHQRNLKNKVSQPQSQRPSEMPSAAQEEN